MGEMALKVKGNSANHRIGWDEMDKVAKILRQFEQTAEPATKMAREPILSEEEFDERGYLWRYPDVADGIARGIFVSAYAHYHSYGRHEGRKPARTGENVGEPFAVNPDKARHNGGIREIVAVSCDRVLISENGGVLLIGWATTSPHRFTMSRS